MTPDDLAVVERSWAELRARRALLLGELMGLFEAVEPWAMPAARRAGWLLGAVEELVGLLSAPSQLAERARAIGETWPDPQTAPCFAIEGRAWLAAASASLPSWSSETEAAWRHAWLLLSDVLAVEALSPFSDGPAPGRRPSLSWGRPREGDARSVDTTRTGTSEGRRT